MRRAFLIYSPSCRLLAVRLWDELRWHGLDIGIDLQDVPTHFERTALLEDLVARSELLILLIAPQSEPDRELRRLHLLAIEQEAQVIALLIPPSTLPNTLQPTNMILMGDYPRALAHLKKMLPPALIQPPYNPHNVLQNLYNENPDVRRANLYLAGKERLTSIMPRAISLMLTDSDAEVRAAAAWALTQLENIESAPALLHALQDEITAVRENASWALVRMARYKDSPATRGLINAVITVLRDKAQPHPTREAAYHVLLRVGGQEANEAIRLYWDDEA